MAKTHKSHASSLKILFEHQVKSNELLNTLSSDFLSLHSVAAAVVVCFRVVHINRIRKLSILCVLLYCEIVQMVV